VTGRGTTVTRRTPAARVRDIGPVFNVLPGQRAAGGAGAGAGIADAPSATYLVSMAALAAVRLVLTRYPPAPASFMQTRHVTADQLRDKDANPAAAAFAFLLNSGAAVGHLMTADVARFDPHDPAAMSADPAALPPAMREYHAWLWSNVCDSTVVHAAQERYRRAMLQPTVAGDHSTRCPSVPHGAQTRPPAPPHCATLSCVRAEARSAPRPTSPTLLRLRTRHEGWRVRRECLGRVSQRPRRSGEPCLQRVASRCARRIRRRTLEKPA